MSALSLPAPPVIVSDRPIEELLPIVRDYANYLQFMLNFTTYVDPDIALPPVHLQPRERAGSRKDGSSPPNAPLRRPPGIELIPPQIVRPAVLDWVRPHATNARR